jgi:four helix bundle protein
MELEKQILIAQNLNYLGTADVERVLSQSGEVSRMLTGLTKKLRQRTTN